MYVFFAVFSIYLVACLFGYVNPCDSVLLRDAGIYSRYNIPEYDSDDDDDKPQESSLRRSVSH